MSLASIPKSSRILLMLTILSLSCNSYAVSPVTGSVTDIVGVQEASSSSTGYTKYYDITIDPSAGSDVIVRTDDRRAAHLLATARDKGVEATVHYKNPKTEAGKYEIEFIVVTTGLTAQNKVTQMKYMHYGCSDRTAAAKEWSVDSGSCTAVDVFHGQLKRKMIAWIQIGPPGGGNPPTPYLVTEEEVQFALESSIDRDCNVAVNAQTPSEICVGNNRVNRIQKLTASGCGTP